MEIGKKVKDVMIPLSEYPHVPYWLTIRQAMGVIRKICIKYKGVYYEPGTMLVFDQQYRLLGILRRRDLLRAIEPTLFKLSFGEEKNSDSAPWEEIFKHYTNDDSQRPVSDVMTPIEVTVEPDDPIEKSIYLMVKHDVGLLPVMSGEKVEGVVRMTDVFIEVIEKVL